jgi:hypothetical protein
MSSINLLAIFNPSNYWRSGQIAIPWQPIAKQFQIPPEELVITDLHDLNRTPLLAQVDRVDPEDPNRDTLIFSLPQAIPPSSKDKLTASALVRLDRGKSIPSEVGETNVEIVYGSDDRERGARLVNSRLIVWFNFVASPENDERTWFGGSATSVQLDRQECLDPFRAARGNWLEQDPEKHCMKVTEIQLPQSVHPIHPNHSLYHPISLFNHSYRLVAKSDGPVRASITIASEPFEYIGPDPVTGIDRHFVCELYRTISLYAGADYAIEELFVKGKPYKNTEESFDPPEAVNLNFAVKYFTHMHLEYEPKVYQPYGITSWFAIGSNQPPYPGYGFATNLQIDSLNYLDEAEENCLSWQLLPGKSARCLHLFMRDCAGRSELKLNRSEDFESHTGHSWYEAIYQPLTAQIYQETGVAQECQSDRHSKMLTFNF